MSTDRALNYRPALDGLRGVAVAAIVVFHLHRDALPGGWLGVDLFFVLSGFLITSLLLRQVRKQGRIGLLSFWAGRARRLLPSLLVMLASVLIAARLLAESGRAPAIAHDVIAACLYVANWRFIVGDEQYFASIGMPSPVLHTWSLSIEEQFYFVFPLVLTGLLLLFRRRLTLAIALGTLAAASATWMAANYTPGTDPSRVYYGTDTRIFELLIGASAGAFFGAHCFVGRRPWRSDRPLALLAWPASAVVLTAFLLVDERTSIVFRGGLVVFCVLAGVTVVAAAGRAPSAFERALSCAPLRGLGVISYSLYLWHWPVLVFMNASVVPVTWLRITAQLLVAFALAYLSWRFIERPIRSNGFGALVPRYPHVGRAVVAAISAFLLAGPLLLTGGAAASAGVRDTQLTVGPYVPMETRAKISLLGNSIPESLLTGFEPAQYPDIDPQQVTSIGCDPFTANRWRDGATEPLPASCIRWKEGGWVELLRTQKPEATIFFIPQTLTSDWSVAGHRVAFGTTEYDKWLTGELGRMNQTVASATGGKLVLANLSCHRQTDFGNDPTIPHVNDDRRVQHVNEVAGSWARANRVLVLDQFGALCRDGYHDSVNGVTLYKDKLHFTVDSARIMWSWLIPEVQTILRGQTR